MTYVYCRVHHWVQTPHTCHRGRVTVKVTANEIPYGEIEDEIDGVMRKGESGKCGY